MTLKTSAIWINRILWTVVVASLLLIATYVSLGRYYISYVEQYQEALVSRVVKAVGPSLTVGHLSGYWSTLSPIITLDDVRLHREGTDKDTAPLLSLGHMRFSLDLLESLWEREFQVGYLKLVDTRVELQEVSPGQWRVAGYTIESGGGTNVDKLIDLVMGIDVVDVQNATLVLHPFQGKQALLSINTLSVERAADFRRLHLQATFQDGAAPLELTIESQGDPRDREHFTAKAYTHLNQIDLVDQLPFLASFGVDLQEARVNGQLWFDCLPGRVISMQGQLTVPLLDIAAVGGHELPPVNDIALGFRFEKDRQDNWQLWVPQLDAKWKTQSFSFTQLYAERVDKQRFLQLPRLDIDDFVDKILSLDLLTGKGLEALETLAPSGELRHLNIQLPYTINEQYRVVLTDAFSLEAELHGVSVEAWQGAPGIKGLDGYLNTGLKRGRVVMRATDFEMFFPVLYRKPMGFTAANGNVSWALADNRVIVESSLLKLQADHGHAAGTFSLDLPLVAGEGEPSMFLAVGLRDTAAHYRDKFIPFKIDQDLNDWLASSIHAGNVVEGGFIYNGSLSINSPELRTIQLYLHVDHVELDYHPDWPAIYDTQGHVVVDDMNVEVISPQAKLFGLALKDVHVTSQPLRQRLAKDINGAWLTVDAHVSGPATDGLRVVNESVIHDLVGGAFDTWQLDGRIDAELKLGVPIGNKELKTAIDFKAHLTDANLDIVDQRLSFTHINGPLNYSSDRGLFSKALTGTFFGNDATVQIDQNKDQLTQVDIHGRLSIADIKTWTGQPALVFLAGASDFNAGITIAPTGTQLRIDSDLKGVSIDLPEPFSKTANELGDFSLTLPLSRKDSLLHLSYNEQIALWLQLQKTGFGGGVVAIGEKEKPVITPGELAFTGKLQALAYDDFQRLLDNYLAEAKRLTTPSDNNAIAVTVRDLHIQKLQALDMEFDDTLINAEHTAKGWRLSMNNNIAEGDIVFPDQEGEMLAVDLKRLSLFDQSNSDPLLTGGVSDKRLDPRNFVDMSVNIDQLILEQEHWGNIAFTLDAHEDGLDVSNVIGNLRGIQLGIPEEPVTMTWLRDDLGDVTNITGSLYVKNLADVLTEWHYEPAITSRKGRLDFSLSWPDQPTHWQLLDLTGEFKLRIEDGRFVNTPEAAGALKLLGIFDLTNILRRLRFDFSDIAKSGISFEKITGRFDIDNGRLSIDDSLKIKSPSGMFRLSGHADLATEQLDMQLIATVRIAKNLPWIAALISGGAWPVAAGAFLAGKVFENQVDKFSSVVHSITGKWDDFDVKFERIFNDKTKK